MRVTIRDVAARAGVSIATVSRVLSGDRHTTPESRDKVLAAATALRYRPSPAMAAIASRHFRLPPTELGAPVAFVIQPGSESRGTQLRQHFEEFREYSAILGEIEILEPPIQEQMLPADLAVELVAHPAATALEQRQDAPPIDVGGRLDPGHLAERRIQVGQTDQRVGRPLLVGGDQ